MSGRPFNREYDNLSKLCQTCGSRFYLRDRKFQSRNRFMARKYCSVNCHKYLGQGGPDFWSHVQKCGTNECWEWQGSLNWKGYGSLSFEGRKMRAHRVAYQLAVGPIPDGLHILHSCDNRRCCNPTHLRAGTNKENVADALTRGRRKAAPIHSIQADPDLFRISMRVIADRYQVSQTTVWRARALSSTEKAQ